MKPTDKLYPTILKDKLANYSITPQNLDTVRTYAHQCQWRKKNLEHHHKKHGIAMGHKFATGYHEAALDAILSPDSSILLRIEKNRLIMYVYTDHYSTKEPCKIVAVLDLDTNNILSYGIKRTKQMDNKMKSPLDFKLMAFDATKKQVKLNKLIPDDDEFDSLEVAIEDYEDLPLLALYTDILRIVRENDEDEMLVWAEDISDWRMRTIEVLIREDWLPEKDAKEIEEVDDFIRKNSVPYRYQPLKDWLIAHPF